MQITSKKVLLSYDNRSLKHNHVVSARPIRREHLPGGSVQGLCMKPPICFIGQCDLRRINPAAWSLNLPLIPLGGDGSVFCCVDFLIPIPLYIFYGWEFHHSCPNHIGCKAVKWSKMRSQPSTVNKEHVLPSDSTCSRMCEYMIKRYQRDQDDTWLKDPIHVWESTHVIWRGIEFIFNPDFYELIWLHWFLKEIFWFFPQVDESNYST